MPLGKFVCVLTHLVWWGLKSVCTSLGVVLRLTRPHSSFHWSLRSHVHIRSLCSVYTSTQILIHYLFVLTFDSVSGNTPCGWQPEPEQDWRGSSLKHGLGLQVEVIQSMRIHIYLPSRSTLSPSRTSFLSPRYTTARSSARNSPRVADNSTPPQSGNSSLNSLTYPFTASRQHVTRRT